MAADTKSLPLDNAAKCLREVLDLTALAATWLDAAPLRIAESLAGALIHALQPELLYIRFTGNRTGPSPR